MRSTDQLNNYFPLFSADCAIEQLQRFIVNATYSKLQDYGLSV